MSDIVNELIVGDSLDFLATVDGYPAGAGWVLKYSLRGPSSIDMTAVASGDDYHVQASSATTAAWLPGQYHWVSVVSMSGQRYTVGSGTLVILPDLSAQVAGYDGRSLAEKSLADAEAALADLSASGKRVKEYTIGTRGAKYYTASELLVAVNYWRIKVANEGAAVAIANGLGNPRNLMVRFRA
jgi:hypothetical protein